MTALGNWLVGRVLVVEYHLLRELVLELGITFATEAPRKIQSMKILKNVSINQKKLIKLGRGDTS